MVYSSAFSKLLKIKKHNNPLTDANISCLCDILAVCVCTASAECNVKTTHFCSHLTGLTIPTGGDLNKQSTLHENKMEKLPMCRICLVENVRMYVVVNKNLHELYEKLTNVPFITVDSRPMLACFFCYTKLKQCLRLLRKCLEAEELFAQMMNEDYQLDPLLTSNHLGFFNGLINSPIVHVNIDGDDQKETSVIKEELPTNHEGLDDIIDPEEHLKTDELDHKTLYNSQPDVEAHHSSDSEEEQLVMENKIKEEEENELSENRTVEDADTELEPENPDKSYPGVEDIPPHDSESDSEDDVPLMEIKTKAEENQEVPKKKRRASVTQRAAVPKNPTLKIKETMPVMQTMNLLSDSKINQTTGISTSNIVAKIKEPITTTCQNSFSQPSNLIQHTGIHTGEKPYKCDICQHSFSVKANFNRHRLIHTGKKPFKCDVCTRIFNQSSHLKLHIRVHTNENRFKCDICQRSYSQSTELKRHIRVHTDENPFKCDVCQRDFNCSSKLKQHIRVHTGEKPFKCDICQRSFNRSCNLKLHIRIHTGEKPYKCDVCQRSFRSESNLKTHSRIHTGEKPFKCDVCQRSFGQSSGLKQHIRVHTGEKPLLKILLRKRFCKKVQM